ncbi:MAG: 50S ribosomal protein L24 [Candidatus Heimdallarchaeaceae archaeon]
MSFTKSKQPRKQRRSYYRAYLHRRNKMMTALLSHELREKYGIKRLPIHKDDKVVVFKNKSEDEEIKGKVIRVLPQRYAVHIEGYSKEKADGTIVSFPVHPSNLVITSLNLKDKKRREIIKRRSKKDLTEEEFVEELTEEEEPEEGMTEDYETIEDEELFEELDDIEVDDLEENNQPSTKEEESK